MRCPTTHLAFAFLLESPVSGLATLSSIVYQPISLCAMAIRAWLIQNYSPETQYNKIEREWDSLKFLVRVKSDFDAAKIKSFAQTEALALTCCHLVAWRVNECRLNIEGHLCAFVPTTIYIYTKSEYTFSSPEKSNANLLSQLNILDESPSMDGIRRE